MEEVKHVSYKMKMSVDETKFFDGERRRMSNYVKTDRCILLFDQQNYAR